MQSHTAVMETLMKKDIELQKMKHAIDWYNGYKEYREKVDRVVCANLSYADRLNPTLLTKTECELFSPDKRYQEYKPLELLLPRVAFSDVVAIDTAELALRITKIEEEIEACRKQPAYRAMMKHLNTVVK
jgi:hypothetical protein